jgi:hypothetical protein
LSPLPFNLYIDGLIEVLTDDSFLDRTSNAFADDIVLLCSDRRLNGAIYDIEHWCLTNDTQLNRNKSQILRLRLDRRTPMGVTSIKGIPVVPTAKYLGIQVDDDFTFRTEAQNIIKELTEH